MSESSHFDWQFYRQHARPVLRLSGTSCSEATPSRFASNRLSRCSRELMSPRAMHDATLIEQHGIRQSIDLVRDAERR